MKSALSLAASLLIAMALTACGGSGGSNNGDGGGDQKPVPKNRVNWASVPAEFNPSIDDYSFYTDNYQKVNVDAFGYNDDVEVVYSDDVKGGSVIVRVYKVWKKSASFGSIQSHSNGKTLEVYGSGSYACSIRVTNGKITDLEGGCYVRIQILLPKGSEVEAYNSGKLMTKRFVAMDNETFLKSLDKTFNKDEKFAIIETYISSYSDIRKTPSLSSYEMGLVLKEFSFKEEKLRALRRLAPYVSDREKLGKVIEDNFSYFEQDEARKAAGL